MTLEKGHSASPTILMLGHFNHGFLYNFDREIVEAMKAETTFPRVGRSVTEDKKQALHLIEFVEEFFMIQYIKEATRKNNSELITLCR